MTIVNAFKGKETISPTDLKQGKTIGFSLVIIFIMNMLGISKAIGKSFEAKVANSDFALAKTFSENSKIKQ